MPHVCDFFGFVGVSATWAFVILFLPGSIPISFFLVTHVPKKGTITHNLLLQSGRTIEDRSRMLKTTLAKIDPIMNEDITRELSDLENSRKFKKILSHLNTPFDIFAFASILKSPSAENSVTEEESKPRTTEENIDSMVPYHAFLKQYYSLYWSASMLSLVAILESSFCLCAVISLSCNRQLQIDAPSLTCVSFWIFIQVLASYHTEAELRSSRWAAVIHVESGGDGVLYFTESGSWIPERYKEDGWDK